jgi:hypothetical protein
MEFKTQHHLRVKQKGTNKQELLHMCVRFPPFNMQDLILSQCRLAQGLFQCPTQRAPRPLSLGTKEPGRISIHLPLEPSL